MIRESKTAVSNLLFFWAFLESWRNSAKTTQNWSTKLQWRKSGSFLLLSLANQADLFPMSNWWAICYWLLCICGSETINKNSSKFNRKCSSTKFIRILYNLPAINSQPAFLTFWTSFSKKAFIEITIWISWVKNSQVKIWLWICWFLLKSSKIRKSKFVWRRLPNGLPAFKFSTSFQSTFGMAEWQWPPLLRREFPSSIYGTRSSWERTSFPKPKKTRLIRMFFSGSKSKSKTFT